MNTKEIREYKKTLKLNNFQREILVGTLLGDAHLETRDNGKTYRLKIEHQLGQRDYTEWLYSHFKEWIHGGIYEKTKPNGKKYVGFTTYSHGALRFYASQFYENRKKRIPKMISKLLSSSSLAIWFMDDGSWKSKNHSTYIMHTLGFVKKDLETVKEVLLQRFNIKAALHKQKSKYWRLYIHSTSAKEFEKIITPYTQLFDSMNAKTGDKMPKK